MFATIRGVLDRFGGHLETKIFGVATTMALTDIIIRSLRPDDKPIKKADERGLFLLLQPSEGKLGDSNTESRPNLLAVCVGGKWLLCTVHAKIAEPASSNDVMQRILPAFTARDEVFGNCLKECGRLPCYPVT